MKSAWPVLILVVFSSKLIDSEKSKLLSVSVLFRHGSRAPRYTYNNDPYNTRLTELWPEGLSYLTRQGKLQQYALGQWYREYYKGFIPVRYDPKFVRVMSSDDDRCIMSAAANLAGLFPPKNEQIWNSDLLWQPVPIHTTPRIKDSIVVNEIPCEKYDKLLEDLFNSGYVTQYLQENKQLFDYLSINAGQEVKSLEAVTRLHDILFIEEYFNLSLPNWTKTVFPQKTVQLLTKVYVLETYNTSLARLRSGPLIDYITTFFENVIKNPNDSQKLLMISAHDTTLGRLLNTLNVFDNTWPEYSSTVFFELRRKQNKSTIINILFKNSTTFRKIELSKCAFDCEFDEFKKIIEPIRISGDDVEKECLNV